MNNYIERYLADTILRKLQNAPVVAILGPRQCGKSTLVKALLASMQETTYLDLERPSDSNKLIDAEAFFSLNRDKLVCLAILENLNALFINEGLSQEIRLERLNQISIQQMRILTSDSGMKRLKKKE
jgi:predicted AAA+ superfamily ATPase